MMNIKRVFFTFVSCLFAGSLCLAADEAPSSGLLTKVYQVSPSFFTVRDGDLEQKAAANPFTDKSTLKNCNIAQDFFEGRGVLFGPGATMITGTSLSQLIIRNNEVELAKVEAIIDMRNELVAPRIVNVVVEFIEVDEGFYHDWMFENRLNKAGTVFRRQVQKWVKSGDARIAETMCVAARSGERAKTQSVSEVIYPTEPGVPGVPNVVLLEGRKSRAPIKAAVASAYETRYVGATMEVDPVLGSDNTTVDLSLAPELVKSLGVIDWPPKSEDPFFTISLPRFYTVKVSTHVTLLSKGYVLLGVGRANGSGEAKGDRPMVLMFARADVGRVTSFKKLEPTRREK